MSERPPRNTEEKTAPARSPAELFFQHSQDLFVMFSAAGDVQALNPAWSDLTGWTVEELRAKAFSAFIHPDDMPAVHIQIAAVRSGGQGELHARFGAKDGSWRALRGVGNLTPQGSTVAIMRDVTEERARLEELELARGTSLMLSEAAGIGGWRYEPDGDSIEWSADILAITGYAPEEMRSTEQFNAICDPEELAKVSEAFGDGVENGVDRTFEHKMLTKDGRWTNWRCTYRTEPRPGGVFALIGISQNITELSAARDRALLGEAQARNVVEAAPFAIAMCDKTLNSLLVSPSLIELFGLEDEAVIGQRIDLLFARSSRRIAEAQARALIGEVLLNNEEPVTMADGQRRWVRWQVRPWRDAEGGIAGVITYVDDVTALVSARREAQGAARKLKSALQAAESASEAKASFLANMSHEIRTPMNGILGVLHLLRREGLSQSGVKLLEEAAACGHMLSELLNDVLDISKIEAGRLELTREPIEPDRVVAGVVSLLEPQAEAKGLALTISGGLGGAWRLGDPVRLRQTLFNLVGNAVKFTTEGSVIVRASEPAPGRLRFEIEDTGVGIPMEAQAGLFQRFTQADASTTRRFGGSGLGLSITRKLAELMGGEVGFQSTPGVGSLFWIEIDAEPCEAPAAVAETDGLWLEGLRLLVVEDNPTNRMIATKLLENLGADVETADDGCSGVAAAARGGFDMILMDIQMPDIDGLEAARRIRALGGPASETPIVALTANVLSHQRDAYLAAGMNGMVGKPISPAALIAEIARIATPHDACQDEAATQAA